MTTGIATTPGSRPPLSVRAVDRAGALLAGRTSTRRRFLYRLAVVGSALALDPLRFLLRPTPAYAAVCGSGNSCGAGWTVFCCTINDGANTCPEGSFVAGWWKVDASAFCMGSPRYYIDCNRKPQASCRCRCNDRGCDRRRICCNVFRYGQCNTHIEGVTEVVCRIITCTPPWKWDPSCGRTVRVSESTRSHSAVCLPGRDASHIDLKYQDLGLVGAKLGRPAGRERDAARGGRKRRYDNGLILWHRDWGAHEVRGPLAKRYRVFDAEQGPLGYPRTDHRQVGDGRGQLVRFEHGRIYHRKGFKARAVLGRSDRRYRQLDGPLGPLGYPVGSTVRANGAGKVTRFQNGAIYMSGRTPAVEVVGAVLAVFEERGGPRDSRLGFPSAIETVLGDGGRLQQFERGVITGAADGPLFAVRRQIDERYRAAGQPDPAWGRPTAHTERVAQTDGLRSDFELVTAFWSPETSTHWLNGPILQRYLQEGGPAGELGFPVSDVATAADGSQQATFERGVITYDPRNGQTRVVSSG